TGPELLLVLKTDNVSRVRDGYISESTGGHARALLTHQERPIYATNESANDRACPRVTLYGKEGVDGSSPSEGFKKCPLMTPFRLPRARPVLASTSTERPPPDEMGFREAWKPSRCAALRACGPTSTQRPPPAQAPTRRAARRRADSCQSRGDRS